MSLDDVVITPTDTIETPGDTAEASAAVSSTSFLRWCTLDISGQALICAACDVSWLRDTADCCWVCGDEGQRVRDLKRG